MAQLPSAELSKVIYDALDHVGYSKESVTFRATFQMLMDDDLNNLIAQLVHPFKPFDVRCAGSRGEGVMKILESDIDLMCIDREFVCVDSGGAENGISVIQTLTNESPPGYTKLIPLDMSSERSNSVLSLCSVFDLNKDRHLFSSMRAKSHFSDCIVRYFTNFQHADLRYETGKYSGPSVCMTYHHTEDGLFSDVNVPLGSREKDNVVAMPYHSSWILDDWKGRNGKRNWPSYDVIRDISTMEGFVVPVGPKFSEEQNFEWRICYTSAEGKLVSHFNPVQIKLYVVMKMIFKEIVAPECDLISSYIVKNILFWFCEGNSADIFSPENLLPLVQQTLAFSLNCLNSNFLPNYIIPSRNLLLGKGSPQDKIALRPILRDLLKEGGTTVFRLRKLRSMSNVILRDPMQGKVYGYWRNKLEMLSLLVISMTVKKFSPEHLFCGMFNSCHYDRIQRELSTDPMHRLVWESLVFHTVAIPPAFSEVASSPFDALFF